MTTWFLGMYKNFLKRYLDFILSLAGLVVLSPVFVVVLIILCITNNGKAFFFQKRPGKNENLFSIIKFKTMNDKKDKDGNLLPDSERMTKIGRFIRNSSLDEIPQLINVFIGQMSIIGPRPLLPQYLSLYNDEQLKRHQVKPGITGWAQVNGRNAITWTQKFKYDVWYVENFSFLLDVKIIYLTVKKVFKSENISQDGHATMEYFKGDN
ncbi:sugar transferase [Pedobacter heparinus]|uniref:sugar transferase n=1 Tax=Pedobacter heparinus TaxID=984 RepID=UPI00292E1C32|nr:sugar transferase [Pedobacter heparinus]